MSRRLLAIVCVTLAGFGLLASNTEAQGSFWVLVNGALRSSRGIQVGNGSLAAPAYSFASNTNGGFYNAGSGSIGVSVSGLYNGAWGFEGQGQITLPAAGSVGFASNSSAGSAADSKLTRVVAGVIGSNGQLQVTATTVAGLPTCNSTTKGAHGFVTDANAATFGTAAATGGANNVPVYCDGTSWKIG